VARVGLARNVAPDAGTIGRMQRLPHGYTHDTRSDGTMVVKRYQGPYADGRRSTERMVLSRLADSVVPVPHLIDAPAGSLRMRHVAGVHGQDLIVNGLAGPVLRSCGRTLRQLQKVEPATVLGGMPGGARAVLVHGDYGPNNMLFAPITHTTAAVIDWEWAHAGDPVEDLAWCEWIIRMHHPEAVDHLPELFDAYGERPNWARRQDAMLAKCHQMLELFRPADATTGTQRWQRNLEITRQWNDMA
jgi:tRNA A-37 threonylcarbamoyl transferase component Bud32